MDTSDLSQVKDFLLLFNRLSETCFQRCVFSLGQPSLHSEESTCIDSCVKKHINFNQKMLSLYMDINPPFQQKKMEEQMAQMEKLKKTDEAPAIGDSVVEATVQQESS